MMTDRTSNIIGSAIRDIRHQRGLKLAAVSRHVSVSTLNAIEHGRMVPSTAMVDLITEGLGLPAGALDLPLLASVHDAEARATLVERLLSRHVSYLDLQQTLRNVMHNASMTPRQQRHAAYLLAHVWEKRGAFRRAIVLLTHLSHGDERLSDALSLEILSLLGKCHLRIDQPQAALAPLLEAVQLRGPQDSWEAAICNLALAWWKVGLYEQAKHHWLTASQRVTHPMRLAQTYLGLGNVALRQGAWEDATAAYRKALVYYDQAAASGTDRLRVLNNLLGCGRRQQAWDEVQAILACIPSDVDCTSVTYGEFLATKAECLWAMGRREEASALIRQAKEVLGSEPVLSWYTVRLLELAVSGATGALFQEGLEALEAALPTAHDSQWAAGVRTEIMRIALNTGQVAEAEKQLNRLQEHLPMFG